MKYYWCMCGNDEFVSRTINAFRSGSYPLLTKVKLNVCSKCGLVYDFHTMETFKEIAAKVPMPNLTEEPVKPNEMS